MRNLIGFFDELPGAGGEPNNGVGAEERAGVCYGQVVLTDVYPVDAYAAGTQGEGDVYTVVDEQVLVRLDDASDGFGELVKVAGADGLGTNLNAGGMSGLPDGFEGVVSGDEVKRGPEGVVYGCMVLLFMRNLRFILENCVG